MAHTCDTDVGQDYKVWYRNVWECQECLMSALKAGEENPQRIHVTVNSIQMEKSSSLLLYIVISLVI